MGSKERAAGRGVRIARHDLVASGCRVRAYPVPAPLRDAAQLALVDRLRARLHPDLTLRTEVPLPIEGDQRAWDGVIKGFVAPAASMLPAEAETRIHDFQAQTRRVMLKCRDAGLDHILFVVAGTRSNRKAVIAAGAAVGELFPVPPRDALAALAAGEHPGGSALVFL